MAPDRYPRPLHQGSGQGVAMAPDRYPRPLHQGSGQGVVMAPDRYPRPLHQGSGQGVVSPPKDHKPALSAEEPQPASALGTHLAQRSTAAWSPILAPSKPPPAAVADS